LISPLTVKVTLPFALCCPVSDSEELFSASHLLSEKDFQKVMGFVAVHLVFRSRLVTMNGGNLLPVMLSNWLDGALNNACQQMLVSSMDPITEGLKKALLLSKPVAEQVSAVSCATPRLFLWGAKTKHV
jgi:hypothetical protein